MNWHTTRTIYVAEFKLPDMKIAIQKRQINMNFREFIIT